MSATALPDRRPARPRLGEKLVAAGWLTALDLRHVLERQARMGERLGSCLVRLGLVPEQVVLPFVAEHLGVAWVQEPELLAACASGLAPAIDPAFAARRHAVPFGEDRGAVLVATSRPEDLATLDELRFALGRRVRAVLCTDEAVFRALLLHRAIPGETARA